MSAGAVAAFIGQTVEPPFDGLLRWSDYAIWVQGNESVTNLKSRLQRLTEGCDGRRGCEWEKLQRNSIWVYEHYFASDVRAVAGLLELLGRRIGGKFDPVQMVNGHLKTA